MAPYDYQDHYWDNVQLGLGILSLGAGGEGIFADAADGAHIALGSRYVGLRSFAAKIGADHLLDIAESEWKNTFLSYVGNAATKFSVSTEGFFGDTLEEMVANEIGTGSNTGWELGQPQQAGRLGGVDFYGGGSLLPNPF